MTAASVGVLIEERKPGTVARVTIENGAKLNTLDSHLMIAFVSELEALAKRDDLRAVLLTGAGEKAFIGGANYAPYVREGKMVALAVDADERSPLFPDTPTFAEIGYPDTLSRSYLSLVAPAGVPQDIIVSELFGRHARLGGNAGLVQQLGGAVDLSHCSADTTYVRHVIQLDVSQETFEHRPGRLEGIDEAIRVGVGADEGEDADVGADVQRRLGPAGEPKEHLDRFRLVRSVPAPPEEAVRPALVARCP